jgi:hypothetical protein
MRTAGILTGAAAEGQTAEFLTRIRPREAFRRLGENDQTHAAAAFRRRRRVHAQVMPSLMAARYSGRGIMGQGARSRLEKSGDAERRACGAAGPGRPIPGDRPMVRAAT